MSFIRLDDRDLVVSSEAIVRPIWTSGVPTQSVFYTSSVQEGSTTGDFYLEVYDTGSNLSSSVVQFDITYGHKHGSGSILYNSLVNGKSPTRSIYGQYRNLIFGDENSEFTFTVSGQNAVTSSDFWVINFSRELYREKLFPGGLNLRLGSGSHTIQITDNSKDVSTVSFVDGGRIYDLVSGSNGQAITTQAYPGVTAGYTPSGSYGYFLPDIGTILLNPAALVQPPVSGGISAIVYSGSVLNGVNNTSLFQYISNSAYFVEQSEETISSDYIFCRARNSEVNYTVNPSFISSSTGEIIYPNLIDSPEVYITAVGLYNDSNECLAVAKLSRPIRKDFTKEALIRVKLDF